MKLGTKIKELRLQKNIDVDTLAKQHGCKPQYIHSIERRNELSIMKFILLTQSLGFSNKQIIDFVVEITKDILK